MIKKYNDFYDDKINESIDNELYTLLLESDVKYSNNFRKVLNRIDNDFSKALLSIEDKDLPVVANYFDIDSERNDFLFFTPDRKAKEILENTKYVTFIGGAAGWLKNSEANSFIFNALDYTPSDEIYVPESNVVGEIISEMTTKKGNTYCKVKFPDGENIFNKEKLKDGRETLAWQSNRQDVRVGRSMNALIKVAKKNGVEVNFSDKDIEEFVNLYKMQIDKLNDKFSLFNIVSGYDIYEIYNRESGSKGTLGGSCMAGQEDYFFQAYTKSDNISLVYFNESEDDDSLLAGRAVLWKLSDGRTFMDRIYVTEDSDIELFREYAKEKGWYRKRSNDSSSTSLIGPGGEETSTILESKLTRGVEGFPYMDTMKYYSPETFVISSSYRSFEGIYFELESTDGHYSDIGCTKCDNSNHDAGNIDCSDCNGRGEEECDDCEGKGEIECSNCNGEGCGNCEDTGLIECSNCRGNGNISCPSCDGGGSEPCGYCSEYREDY